MADDVRVTNLPDSGSREAVAFGLWKFLRNTGGTSDEQLKFYVKCLDATKGVAPK